MGQGLLRIAAIAALSIVCLQMSQMMAHAQGVTEQSAPNTLNYSASNAGRLGVGDSNVLINSFGICSWVDNGSNNDLFVPLGSAAEWQAFVDHAPASVTRDSCCQAQTMTVMSSDGQTISVDVGIGRERPGMETSRAALTHVFSVTRADCTTHCNGSTTCNTNSGVETVRQEVDCSGGAWTSGDRTVTGGPAYNPPIWQDCHAAINGVCGPVGSCLSGTYEGHGITTSTAECNNGGSISWYSVTTTEYACVGSNGGSTAFSCSSVEDPGCPTTNGATLALPWAGNSCYGPQLDQLSGNPCTLGDAPFPADFADCYVNVVCVPR